MKNKTMSSKYDKHSHKKSSMDSRNSRNDSDNYKHVLKERHSRNDEKNKRKDKDKGNDLKHSSHSHKGKKASSPHRSSHRKDSPSKSKERTDGSNHHRSRKHYHDSDTNESYEELSRRKRKLESELRALDLEEAAAREAENKKSRRETSDSSRKKDIPDIKLKKEPDIKIKKEPISDEEKKLSKSKVQHDGIKSEKDKSKNKASKSSEDEKSWGKSNQNAKINDKEKPNFAVSGKLAEETNTYNGIVIKYNEPSEARKPKRRWRLYPFKGDSDLPFIPIHRQSAYLFGRTRLIADIPIDHPSCSKQHAVLQFRLVPYKREDGTTGRRVRPYIIDLESSNGTYVNNNKIEPRRYVELVEKDVIKFGYSSREYVLLHEGSKNNEEDDDVLELNDKNE